VGHAMTEDEAAKVFFDLCVVEVNYGDEMVPVNEMARCFYKFISAASMETFSLGFVDVCKVVAKEAKKRGLSKQKRRRFGPPAWYYCRVRMNSAVMMDIETVMDSYWRHGKELWEQERRQRENIQYFFAGRPERNAIEQ
jgi:hypothetical protein